MQETITTQNIINYILSEKELGRLRVKINIINFIGLKEIDIKNAIEKSKLVRNIQYIFDSYCKLDSIEADIVYYNKLQSTDKNKLGI